MYHFSGYSGRLQPIAFSRINSYRYQKNLERDEASGQGSLRWIEVDKTMKRAGKKAKTTKRKKGFVLKVTDKVIEWELEAQDKTPVDEIFGRLLPKFGWSQNEAGVLEHVGLEDQKEAG